MQRLLDLDHFSEEKHRAEWDRHGQALDSDDDLSLEILEQMRGTELVSFKSTESFRLWQESERSSLLVLSGYNDISIIHAFQCWVSPIASEVVKGLHDRADSPIYAYYALPQNGILSYSVVSVILLQLLRQRNGILRDEKRYMELRTELGKFKQTGLAEGDKASAMERVAERVIHFFDKSETLYIIVDRADRCRVPSKADHRKILIKTLVKMVEATRCKLKILTVIDGRSWRVENYQDELGVKMKDRVIVHTAEQRLKYQWLFL